MELSERLGPVDGAVQDAVDDLVARRAVERAWSGDHTLWQDDPTEVADRLGWLHVVDEVAAQVDDLALFASELHAGGIDRTVLMGMGGSSLFPEVLARTFPKRAQGGDLRVLDTTHPAMVGRVADEHRADRTLFVAASKSGSTIETRSHLAAMWERHSDPANFAAITDPGSDLAALARDRGFRRVFENRPDIGGRYSALSYFGVVPGLLHGVDMGSILASAQRALADLRSTDTANPGLRLGAAMGAAARQGRDKLTLVIDGRIETFGLWIEQLIAESTGKHGTGVVPVAGEPLGPAAVYGDDRLFVAMGDTPPLDDLVAAGHPVLHLTLDDPLELGALVVVWEFATAMCGAVLGINPFDQPNVAEAKAATNRVLDGDLPAIATEPLAGLLGRVQPGDYLAIQAYLDPESDAVARIDDARVALRDRYRVATTVGIGPRFLHSTGQLHKGGPPTGLFVQVVDDDPGDVPIPGQPYGFGTLFRAQAAGDYLTLRDHGLRVARVALDDLLEVTA